MITKIFIKIIKRKNEKEKKKEKKEKKEETKKEKKNILQYKVHLFAQTAKKVEKSPPFCTEEKSMKEKNK